MNIKMAVSWQTFTMVVTRSGSGDQCRHLEIHLITGGAGYIGRRLALGLRNRGHLVRLFDWTEPSVDMSEDEGITFVKVKNSVVTKNASVNSSG